MEREADTRPRLNPIAVSIAGFVAGVFIASFVSILPLVSFLVVCVASAILVTEKAWRGSIDRTIFLIALVLISAGCGAFRYAVKDFHITEEPSAAGIVVDEPLETENTVRFTYEADNGGKVLVSAPLYTPVEYGDRVEVSGKLSVPGVIEGENGARDFDYGAYLSKDDIYWTMSFADVKVLEHGQGNPLKASLIGIKNNLISHIEGILPEPQASLLAGLLVAGKGSLPGRVLEDFRQAGVIHIVVLSGFNVTLIAVFLHTLLEQAFLAAGLMAVPLATGLASAAGIVLFVLMTGATATVVRAAAMAMIALLAKHLGRSFSAPRALALAACVMLMFNPKLLIFDPSFQLSFLATLGLIYLMPPVERFFARLPERFQFKEIVSQTVATQLAVLPLLVYSTGRVSLVSLPANLAILPLVPFTMLVGFVATALSYAGAILAWPVSLASHFFLSAILDLAHFFGTLPFATAAVPMLLIVACYASGILVAWKPWILKGSFRWLKGLKASPTQGGAFGSS